eukprot:sb/3467167/
MEAGTAEYKVALELELWKDIHIREIEKVLEKRENELVEKISSSYRQHCAALNAEIEGSKKTCDKLVTDYTSRLSSIEKKEKVLNNNLLQFQSEKDDFNADKVHRTAQTRGKSEVKRDILSLETSIIRTKVEDLEAVNEKLKMSLLLLESQVEKKTLQLRETVTTSDNNQPSATQAAAIQSITEELGQLRSRMAKLSVSKERYKMKRHQVLSEISRPQVKVGPVIAEQEAQSKKPVAENVATSLADELAEIVTAMNNEKQNAPIFKEDRDTRIEELIRERATLLSTGVYTASDFLISEIDRRIKELLD